MIRIETSRHTAVTFKTEKAALNRVAKDAEWFANAAEAGEQGEVEVRSRFDAEQGRTLFDVDYVVYTEVAPEDVPEGAQGQVSGARVSHLGKRIPYGYAATVVALHESGRLRLLNYTGTLVQREDEVLTLLPGSLDAAPAVDPRGTLQASLLERTAPAEVAADESDCATCGAEAGVPCDPFCIGLASAQDEDDPYAQEEAADAKTSAALRSLLHRDNTHAVLHGAGFLLPAERSALDSALFVLEG